VPDIIKAFILGLVQGATEFIPVSSSGHLVLLPRLFGWQDFGLAFDVAAHMGTLMAIILYFRNDWVEFIKGFFRSFTMKPSRWEERERTAWMIVGATIPAALAGFFFGDVVEQRLRTLEWVAIFLIVGAVVMSIAELLAKEEHSFEGLKPRDAAIMGLFQAIALAPGLSRSGATISGGLICGLERDAAARFSFLMAAPVTLGAGLLEAGKLVGGGINIDGLLVGTVFLTSTVAGFLTIKYLLSYLRRGTLFPFIIYSGVVGFVVLAVKALL